MDILHADDMKWTMRVIAHYAQKKLESELQNKYNVKLDKNQTFIDFVHQDLMACSNQSVRSVYKQILAAAHEMNTNYQTSTIADLGSFMLWVVYKDTAYRDPFFWILKNLINDDDFKKQLDMYAREPKDWYCPRWIESKDKTKKLRDEGVISEYDLSPEEKNFVPNIMYDRVKQQLDDELKKNKLRSK